MPTYFFKTTYRGDTHETDGLEMPDDHAAWAEATTACGQIIRDLDGRLATGGEWCMEVRRDDEPLYRLRLFPEKLTQT
jgi:hypothetical protein